MNSVQKANHTYYYRNKDILIKMSLKYDYENKDIILSQSKIKAKTYYYKIKYTPKYFRKLLFCLLYTSPSPRDLSTSRMPSSA